MTHKIMGKINKDIEWLQSCINIKNAIPFIKRYEHLIRNTIYSMANKRNVYLTKEDADDLIQITFEDLFKNDWNLLKKYDEKNGISVTSWIIMLTQHSTWNYFTRDYKDTDINIESFDVVPKTEIDFKTLPKWIKESLPLNSINLSNTDLQKRILSEFNLEGINLSRLDLSRLDLKKKILADTDLTGTNLKETNLSYSDLSYANLNNSDLCGTNLRGANLYMANLSETNISKANINEADFEGANFNNAITLSWIKKGLNSDGIYYQSHLIEAIRSGFKNLSGANLKGAELSEINLSKAELNNSNLEKAFLIGTNLNKTNLKYANLSGAFLSGANLCDANLTNASLKNSNIREADLNGANLSSANLFKADLSESNLINTNFSNANITGVNIYGTARDDWMIDGIKCEYFFSDYDKKYQIPKNGKFLKGEFEERYKQYPTIEYIFNYGFSPLDAFIMDQVVKAINEQQPEIELRLDSFHSRGQPRAVFTVLHNDYKDEALKQVTSKYEQKIKFLEGKNEILKELVFSYISKPQQFIQGKQITIGDNTMGDSINFSGNGNIAFGKDNANVNQTNVDYSSNNELLKEVNKLKAEILKFNIDRNSKNAIAFHIDVLEKQVKSDNKNAVLLKSTLESIKAITQGALGSAMGSALVETFKRVGLMIT